MVSAMKLYTGPSLQEQTMIGKYMVRYGFVIQPTTSGFTETGSFYYNSTMNQFQFLEGTTWKGLGTTGGGDWTRTGTVIYPTVDGDTIRTVFDADEYLDIYSTTSYNYIVGYGNPIMIQAQGNGIYFDDIVSIGGSPSVYSTLDVRSTTVYAGSYFGIYSDVIRATLNQDTIGIRGGASAGGAVTGGKYVIGVYGVGDSTGATSGTGQITVGVQGDALGDARTDWAVGGRFNATGGTVNYGVDVVTGNLHINGGNVLVANAGYVYIYSADDDKSLILRHNDTDALISNSGGGIQIDTTGLLYLLSDSTVVHQVGNTHDYLIEQADGSDLLRWDQSEGKWIFSEDVDFSAVYLEGDLDVNGDITAYGSTYGTLEANYDSDEYIQIYETGSYAYIYSNYNPIIIQASGEGVLVDDDLDCSGTVSAAIKSFSIDHPLDPVNKVLRHASIEGPELANLYRFTVKCKDGKTKLDVPDYFWALNGNVMVQVSPINQLCNVSYVIENNEIFVLSSQNCDVSVIVTGSRIDEFALDNPLIVEERKVQKDMVKTAYRKQRKEKNKNPKQKKYNAIIPHVMEKPDRTKTLEKIKNKKVK